MGLLVFTARRAQLKNRVSDLNYKLMQKTQELQELQQYATAVSDGGVSINDFASAPTSQLGNLTQAMVGSHNFAMMNVQMRSGMISQQMGMASQQMQAQGVDAAQQTQYLQYMQMQAQNQAYETAKQEYLKQVQSQLHSKEKAMEQEKMNIETQLQMAEAELQSCEKGVQESIKDAAPQYV